jgi:xanthine dehydrogenase iron-sulfur cluster and FAD-binding subunit A
VKPAPFGYRRPGTTAGALTMLAALGPEAKVLAGGQSLLPLLSMRLASVSYLVDINHLTELSYVRVDGGHVRVGALARHRDVLADRAAAAAQPLLGKALAFVAHPAVRNRGTTVGSIVHADPAGEMTAVLALLAGEVQVASVDGERLIPAGEFFLGPLESAVRAGELATEVRFPVLPPGSGTGFAELSRRQGDYALCGVAALVRLGPGGRIEHARAAYLSMAPEPLVLDLTEAVAGLPCGGAAFPGAARLVRARVEPEPDIHASADYRRHLAGVLTERALAQALAEACGPPAAGERAEMAGGRPAAREGTATGQHQAAVQGTAAAAGLAAAQGAAGGGGAAPATDAGSDRAAARAAEAGRDAAERHRVRLTVNGIPHNVTVPARLLLSDCIRHDLRLTGTHVGCEHGVCGACTVLLDGQPVRSCLMLAVGADGRQITTVEGLTGHDGTLSPVQQAFADCHGLQCGFCTPGFLTTITAGLRGNPDPTPEQARELVGGNLCRCTGYYNIVRSVLRAAELLRGQAATASPGTAATGTVTTGAAATARQEPADAGGEGGQVP